MPPKGETTFGTSDTDLQPPPSSYPGIWKYPTGRDKPFRAADDWLVAKRKDDDIGKLWRVHDKLYDLEPFVKNHPGGPLWLQMTQGTDITEAFETSHVANIKLVEQTLATFYIADATHPRISPYTFKEDGFYKTLKRKIEPILKEVGTGPTRKVMLIQDTEVFLFAFLGILGVWYNSTILQLLSGFFLAISLITSHNFVHLKEHWRQYYFDLGLMSSYEWKISHSLSHHLFPNTLMDVQLTLFPTYEFLGNRPKNWFQRNTAIFHSHFVYAVSFWLDIPKRIYYIANGEQKFRFSHLMTFVELFLCIFIAPNAYMGLKSWIFINTVSSYIFLTIGASAAHHHPDVFHDGDTPRPDPDFGLCQLDATKGRTDSFHKNIIVIMASFGDHCLHHLFPTICHSKLPYIESTFRETLKEFSEDCVGVTHWALYKGCFQQLSKTETTHRVYKSGKSE